MSPMSPVMTWHDLIVRILATVLAGGLIGFDRDEHGGAAGLRTTILVCLAAAIAMMQANVLLPMTGKQPGSYITLDLMRLPLGILSGVGFLGAGAILRHGDRVIGLTTAATLWIVTVIGLCFGGGQFVLGGVATMLGFGVLSGLKIVERGMSQNHKGQLTVSAATSEETMELLFSLLRQSQIRIVRRSIKYHDAAETLEAKLDLRWRGRHGETSPPEFLAMFAARPGIRYVEWAPVLPQ